MAQQIVTITIQEAEDGTKSVTPIPDDITLVDGDSFVFVAPADTSPQIVFADAPAPLIAAAADLRLEDDPLAPLPPATLDGESTEGVVIDENIPAGEYPYSVQIPGAVLATGRIKIIRQQ